MSRALFFYYDCDLSKSGIAIWSATIPFGFCAYCIFIFYSNKYYQLFMLSHIHRSISIELDWASFLAIKSFRLDNLVTKWGEIFLSADWVKLSARYYFLKSVPFCSWKKTCLQTPLCIKRCQNCGLHRYA